MYTASSSTLRRASLKLTACLPCIPRRLDALRQQSGSSEPGNRYVTFDRVVHQENWDWEVAVFWGAVPCSLAEGTGVLEVLAAPITRALSG
jgi:hypothetical protein